MKPSPPPNPPSPTHTLPLACSSMSTAPLRWLGLASDTRLVRVPLFQNYREKAAVPFMAARVAIKVGRRGREARVMARHGIALLPARLSRTGL